MTRWEGDDVVAYRMQAFQFRSEEDGTRGRAGASKVEGSDSDWVACCNNAVLDLIVQHPREHAIEVFWSVNIVLHVLPVYQLI